MRGGRGEEERRQRVPFQNQLIPIVKEIPTVGWLGWRRVGEGDKILPVPRERGGNESFGSICIIKANTPNSEGKGIKEVNAALCFASQIRKLLAIFRWQIVILLQFSVGIPPCWQISNCSSRPQNSSHISRRHCRVP